MTLPREGGYTNTMSNKAHAYTSASSPRITRGFTIVELLIVIVVIAILAAISIVAYRGIQDRANSSAASAKLTQAAKQVQLYYAEHATYPTSLSLLTDLPNTQDYGYTTNADNSTYCLTATVSNKSYYLNTTTHTTPTPGGCPGHGQGGVVAVTNYIRNPDLVSISQTALNYAANATRTASGGVLTARVTSLISPATTTNGVSIYGLTDTGSFYSAKYRVRGVNGAVGKTSWAVLHGGGQRAASANYILTSDWQEVNVLAQSAATSTSTHLYIYFGQASAGWAVNDAIEITQPTIQRVSAAGQPAPVGFYSGSSPNWVWNGTPDSSTSTGPAL